MASLLPGTEVLARGLRWEVVSVLPAGDQELHRLRCLDGALRGEEYDFLVPLEKLEPLTQELDPARAARLAHWRVYHQAFLLEQALGPTALLAAQPGRLKLAPYQLVPVMRALQMSRPRMLLADGVGLGKTVEAGLVLAELIARRRAHRILLVTPAGPLLQQWRREMRERFGLRFRVLDRDSLQDIRYATELGANPFDHEALGLISIDFAKQEKVLQDLERTHYDVAVIDEAHHCAALGAAGEQEDSQRRRLAGVLARRADGLLLLTATSSRASGTPAIRTRPRAASPPSTSSSPSAPRRSQKSTTPTGTSPSTSNSPGRSSTSRATRTARSRRPPTPTSKPPPSLSPWPPTPATPVPLPAAPERARVARRQVVRLASREAGRRHRCGSKRMKGNDTRSNVGLATLRRGGLAAHSAGVSL